MGPKGGAQWVTWEGGAPPPVALGPCGEAQTFAVENSYKLTYVHVVFFTASRGACVYLPGDTSLFDGF